MINKSEYISVTAELNFAFLRMNIDIHCSGFAVYHQETDRELVLHDGILICLIYSSRYGLAVDQTAVYEYDLKTSFTSYK